MPSKSPANKPYISVVIPAYNTRSTIAETIDSVLSQEYTNYEIIVIDDGSPDSVGEYVKKKYQSNVKVFKQENSGLAGARNAGIKHATGDYVAFLDSDDVWLPNKLALQIDQIKNIPNGSVFYTNCFFWDGNARSGLWTDKHLQKDGDIAEQLISREVMIPVLTTVVRRQVLEDVGGFDPNLRQVEDYDLWLRLAVSGHKFYSLSMPLALYRLNPVGLSQNRLLMAQTQLGVYEELIENADSRYRNAIKEQISIFKLEVLQQLRDKLPSSQRIKPALLTLKMIQHKPQKLAAYLTASILFLLFPKAAKSRLS